MPAAPFRVSIEEVLGVPVGASNPVPTVPADSSLATYSASVTQLAIAAAATDFFTITGASGKVVKVKRLRVSGLATAAVATSLAVVKRSTANSAGTATTPTAVPHDSGDAAASAVVRAYTANPTTGNLVGPLKAVRPTFTTAAGVIPEVPQVFEFGSGSTKPVILRSASEVLALNLNGATVAGLTLDIDIEWTEEEP